MDYVYHGSGSKGVAYIGVIKALEEENIEFDYISGTSSGSIVASLYASGYNADEIYNIFKKYKNKLGYIDLKNIIKSSLLTIFTGKLMFRGLNTGKNIEKIINIECNKKGIDNISNINKSLFIPSVDLHDGKIYIFTSKLNRATFSNNIVYENNINIGKAVRASCSYPGIFIPVKYNRDRTCRWWVKRKYSMERIKKK